MAVEIGYRLIEYRLAWLRTKAEHERLAAMQPRRRAARVHRGQPLALRFRAEPRQPVFDQPVSDLDSHCFVPSNRGVCAPTGRRTVGMVPVVIASSFRKMSV